ILFGFCGSRAIVLTGASLGIPLTCCQVFPPSRELRTPDEAVPTRILSGCSVSAEMQLVRGSRPPPYGSLCQPLVGSELRNNPELVAASRIGCWLSTSTVWTRALTASERITASAPLLMAPGFKPNDFRVMLSILPLTGR